MSDGFTDANSTGTKMPRSQLVGYVPVTRSQLRHERSLRNLPGGIYQTNSPYGCREIAGVKESRAVVGLREADRLVEADA
jgi:hypothetical protein